jgi:hypothetical protein
MVSKADRLFAAGKIDAPERDRRNAQSKRDLKGGGAARKQPVARRRAGRASGGAAHHLRHDYAPGGIDSSGRVTFFPVFAGLPSTFDSYRRVSVGSVWFVGTTSLGTKEENMRFAACFSVTKPKGTETFSDILGIAGHVVVSGAMTGRKINLPLRKDDRKEWRKDGKPVPAPSTQLYVCWSAEWASPATLPALTAHATFDCVGDAVDNTSL